MTRTEQAIERLDNLVQQNGALVQQNSTLTGILEVCDMNAEERALGKKKIVQAIIKMGGSASEDDSLFALAAAIKKLKTLDPRTVVTDDLPRPVNVGTYICQPELLKNKIVHAYSEEATASNAAFRSSETLKSFYGHNVKSVPEYPFEGTKVDNISLPSITNLNHTGVFHLLSDCKKIDIRSAVDLRGFNIFRQSRIKVIDMSSCSTDIGTSQYPGFKDVLNLIDLIIGKNIKGNFTPHGYNPTEAYSKTSASLVDKGEPFSTNNQKWNYNLREHFAANLDDRTGLDAFTITFGSTVLAQMEEATIEAFTSKNWTLA